jgi:phage terminase small subunit|tara:strand:+ start:355 stop:855 length:501 start_codon:yes stop_codon:yes gene_type:complete
MDIDIIRDRLTPKQIKFCVLFVEHGDELSATECAIQAGYSKDSARQEASNLRKKPNVAEYIRQLRNEDEKRYEVNLHRHLKRLDQLSKGAEEKGNWNAAVQAEKSRGQVAGLYVDRKEIMHGSIDQLSRDEVDKLLTDMDKKLSIEGSFTVHDDQTRDEILEDNQE